MDLQPKTEPGVPPGFGSTIHTNLNEMTVSDLVLKLRTAFRFDEFDSVEKVLVARDARLKAQIASLQEKVELERMAKIHAEEELTKREEQCQRGKRAEDCYEKLLKEVKKSGLADMNTIEDLRNRNTAILAENRKLEELKKQWLDDSKAVAELRIKVRELEDERAEHEVRKKNWEDDKSALDALRRRNSELEEELKKILAENDKSVIDELRAENTKLLDDKRALVESQHRKYLGLHERLLKLEDYAKPFMSLGDTGRCENTDGEKPKADPQERKELNEMDVRSCNVASDPFQRNKDTCHSIVAGIAQSAPKVDKGAPDASATGRSGSVPIIDIKDSDDDDDDDQTHQRKMRNLSRGQTLEMLKRRISFSDTSSSSSEHRPLNSRDIPSNKKSKTEVDSPVLNSLPRRK